MQEILQSLPELITTLLAGAGGAFSVLLFRKQKKDKLNLENDKTQIEMWKELYNELKNEHIKLQEKQEKTTDIYIRALNRCYMLTIMKCKDLSCKDRQPPFGDNKLKDIEKEFRDNIINANDNNEFKM